MFFSTPFPEFRSKADYFSKSPSAPNYKFTLSSFSCCFEFVVERSLGFARIQRIDLYMKIFSNFQLFQFFRNICFISYSEFSACFVNFIWTSIWEQPLDTLTRYSAVNKKFYHGRSFFTCNFDSQFSRRRLPYPVSEFFGPSPAQNEIWFRQAIQNAQGHFFDHFS